ncbi:hypothetical protein ACOMHN_037166 [Nucella lapillus]
MTVKQKQGQKSDRGGSSSWGRPVVWSAVCPQFHLYLNARLLRHKTPTHPPTESHRAWCGRHPVPVTPGHWRLSRDWRGRAKPTGPSVHGMSLLSKPAFLSASLHPSQQAGAVQTTGVGSHTPLSIFRRPAPRVSNHQPPRRFQSIKKRVEAKRFPAGAGN